MNDKKIDSPKDNHQQNITDTDLIKVNKIKNQKVKYFTNKNYQRFIGFVFFLIGCYFLYFLYSFVFSIYVSSLFNINIIV